MLRIFVCPYIKNYGERLRVLVLFRRAQTTGANVLVRNLAVYIGRNFMDIGVEAALGLFVRVADVVAGYSAFAADRTYLAHGYLLNV